MSDTAKTTVSEQEVLAGIGTWGQFLGVMTIIMGAITCLGCITAAIGIPQIFAGIRLCKVAEGAKKQAAGSSNEISALLSNLKGYLLINGVLMIVGLSLMVLYIIVVFAVLLPMGFFRNFG